MNVKTWNAEKQDGARVQAAEAGLNSCRKHAYLAAKTKMRDPDIKKAVIIPIRPIHDRKPRLEPGEADLLAIITLLHNKFSSLPVYNKIFSSNFRFQFWIRNSVVKFVTSNLDVNFRAEKLFESFFRKPGNQKVRT